ncbi:MAG: hypothetical protein ACI9HK_003908 [Pirellulaceae bacterium]|jgi:hypothetical protein
MIGRGDVWILANAESETKLIPESSGERGRGLAALSLGSFHEFTLISLWGQSIRSFRSIIAVGVARRRLAALVS